MDIRVRQSTAMNLLDLNVGAGAPQTKPWLTPVVSSLEAVSLTAGQMSAGQMSAGTLAGQNTWRPSTAINPVLGVSDIFYSASAFVGGVCVVGLGGIGSIQGPTSAQVNALLPASVTGSSFVFTVINRNVNPVTTNVIFDASNVSTGAAYSATAACVTSIWYVKQSTGMWLPVNTLY